jgi:hypothetical protein
MGCGGLVEEGLSNEGTEMDVEVVSGGGIGQLPSDSMLRIVECGLRCEEIGMESWSVGGTVEEDEGLRYGLANGRQRRRTEVLIG